MKVNPGRVRAIVAGGLAIGGLMFAPATAEANSWPGWVGLSTGHNVGLYWTPSTAYKATDNTWDLHPGDQVHVICWTTGENIANQGDVWYHVDKEYYQSVLGGQSFDDYVYGAYVDGNSIWHARATNGLPQC